MYILSMKVYPTDEFAPLLRKREFGYSDEDDARAAMEKVVEYLKGMGFQQDPKYFHTGLDHQLIESEDRIWHFEVNEIVAGDPVEAIDSMIP